MAQKLMIKANSIEKIEQLLQEIYNQSCQELVEIQGEINKIASSTGLGEATIDEKTKYAKAMNDFTTTKLKTISMKFEVAKLMAELIKHNGDVEGTLNDPAVGKVSKLDISGWRNMIKNDKKDSSTEVYDLK